MKKVHFLLFLGLVFAGCQTKQSKQTNKSNKQEDTKTEHVPLYSFAEFEKFLHQKDSKLHVVNFWATWCKPCVEELSYFEKLDSLEYVDVLLVSLDMPKMKDSHVVPFLQKRNLNATVVLLDDPNSNAWIPKVNKSWSGVIPATLIYKDSVSKFYSKAFENYEELLSEVEKFK